MNVTTKTKLDWAAVVSSLLNRLQKADFAVIATDDGEERVRYDPDASRLGIRRRASKHLTGTDEAWVILLDLRHQPKTEARKLSLFLVLGNGPEEIACDYSSDERLDAVISAHYDAWEGSQVPRIDY